MMIKRVTVKWKDATTAEAGWKDIKDALKEEPISVESTGWLLFNGKQHIILAMDYDEEHEQVAGVHTIPKRMLTEITDI